VCGVWAALTVYLSLSLFYLVHGGRRTRQIGTTKGTGKFQNTCFIKCQCLKLATDMCRACEGGDVLILEEAAYCDEGFFYVRSIFMKFNIYFS